jgi:hypothetical protein
LALWFAACVLRPGWDLDFDFFFGDGLGGFFSLP